MASRGAALKRPARGGAGPARPAGGRAAGGRAVSPAVAGRTDKGAGLSLCHGTQGAPRASWGRRRYAAVARSRRPRTASSLRGWGCGRAPPQEGPAAGSRLGPSGPRPAPCTALGGSRPATTRPLASPFLQALVILRPRSASP